MKKIIYSLVVCLLLVGCGSSNTVEEVEEETAIPLIEELNDEHSFNLLMGGDALIHGSVYLDAQNENQYEFDDMMKALNRVGNRYDLMYYNQETILGGIDLGLSSYPCFNSPQSFGDTMRKLGFNVVSLANNHSLDQGEIGIVKSMEYWNQYPEVLTSGTSLSKQEQDEIKIREVNGITYTLLSYTYGCNGLVAPSGKEYLVNVYTGHEEEMLNQVKKASELVDVVLVAMHWGIEYTNEPTTEQKELAKELVDAGATIVIGNHPHAIQPIEWIDGKLVLYSLGNLVSGQFDEGTHVGMLAGITVKKNNDVVYLDDLRADLIYTCSTPYYDVDGVKHQKDYYLKLMKLLDENELENHEEKYQEYLKIIEEYDAHAVNEISAKYDELYGCDTCEKGRKFDEE